MEIYKFNKVKDSQTKHNKYLILLHNFDKSCLKVTLKRSGEHKSNNMYNIEYQKFGEKEILPLYFVIPVFYGYSHDDLLNVFSKKYINICCNNVLNEFKDLIQIIVKKICEIRGTEYDFNDHWLKIRVVQCNKEMPVNTLMKINWAIIGLKLIIESEKGLFVLLYLQECFWELNIKNEPQSVKN